MLDNMETEYNKVNAELQAAQARIATLKAALRNTLVAYDGLRVQLSQHDIIIRQSDSIIKARAALDTTP